MSKKILISAMIMLWLGIGLTIAQGSNIMILHDVEAEAGEIITVELEIVNDDAFVGFNLDIPLPDGFTYIEGTAELFRKTDHLLSFSINQFDVAKILAVSITLEEFLGNDGIILSFDLQTPSVPGEYPLEIVDAIIGDTNAQDILTGTFDGMVTLLGDEPDPLFTLTLQADPPDGGLLSGAGQYEEGTDVSITAEANTGFEFINWTDTDGNEVSSSPAFVYTMPAEDVLLIANFEEDEDPDPDPDPENVMIIPDLTANAGDVITIELEIENDEEFVGFNLDIPLPDGFTYIDGSAELFRKTNHQFMFNVIEETNLAKIIAFSITNDAFLDNEGVIFSFDLQTPNVPGDYLFEILDPIIGNIDAEDILTGTVDGIITLEEVDPEPVYVLTLETNPLDGGTVTGAGEYEAGTDVTISATPAAGFIFINWTDAEGNEIADSPAHIYTMPAADVTLTANFEEDEDPEPENIMLVHDITANAGDIITIEVEILNDEEFVGFNLDIPLPDGFDYIDGTAQLFRKTNHQFVFNVVEETNLAKIIAFSITNDEFLGSDGVIFSFDVQTPNTPGEYPLEILSAVIGNIDAQNILTGTIDGNVTLEGVPEPDNIMMIHDIYAEAGEIITVEIEIMNDEEFVGFNLDIPLPDGFEYVDGSAELFRGTDHQFGFNVTGANVAKIIAFSITNDAFLGNDGVVFSFDLTTPAFAGEHELEILNAVIGNIDAQNILTATINGTVFLEGEALPENIMKIHDITADAGDIVTIEVEIMNDEEFVGFNLDIPLPEGFEYVEGTAELFRGTNHQFVFNVVEATNLAKIIAFSITNDEFLGNEGVIFSFDVQTTDVPGEYPLEIATAVIGNIDAQNILTGTIDGLLTLEEPPIEPDPENIMKIHDITAEVGDIVTVELEILNDEEFVGFNLDIPLPAGFNFIEGTAELFRGTDHDFAINVIPGNIVKIIAFSITNDAFLGNDGVIFSFDVETPNVPGEYLLEIVDGVIGNVDAQDILTGTIDGTVILEGEPAEQYSLTLMVNPEDAGVVTGEGDYFEGEEVFITAEPNTGFVFVDWTDADGNLVSDEAEFTYIMPAEDVELTANFELDEEPDPENIMKIHDIVAQAGEIITIELEILNDEEFVGFNLDIPLPEGFNYVEGTAELFRKTNHQFVFNVVEATNLAKIIAFSITNDEFLGNEGVIFSFDVETPNVPGEYTLDILSAVIGNIDAQNILTGTIPGTVILEDEAEPENIMKIHDIVADAGEIITIELEILNDEEFVGFNLDIPLPEGFNYVEGTAELFRKTNHQFVFNVVEATNLAKIIAFSITNDEFLGNEGVIFSFDVETPNVPGEYTLDILSAVIGNIDAQNILTGTIPGTVILEGEVEPENIMKIHDIVADAGEIITIELEILNDEEFVGFNLDIPLPEGFNYVEGTAELFRKTNHQFVFNVVEATNLAKIIAFSITNDEFLGNEGVIFSFDVETPNVPGEYTLDILSAVIGNIDAQNILTGTIPGTVILEGEPIGENIMKIHDITATAGDIVSVELEIMNDDEFVGFNLRVPLPDGFDYIDGTAELFRKTDHEFIFNITPDNVANILAFSITNDAFIGNDGVIFSFDVQTSNIPGEYLLEITDAIIGNIDAENIITGTIDGTVILTPPDDPYTLTLIANPEDGGEVIGAGEYFAGENVEVDAIPNEGWEFINWTDEDGNVVSEDAFNVIEMPAEDLTLIANFELIAEPENIMKIHDIEAEAGDIITIELEIMNDEEFVGFNLEIPLPAGFEYIEGTAELFRKTNHQFAFNVIEGNLARIIAFSITNDAFLGNDGIIFSFDVTTPTIAGEYTLEILDAIIGNIDAENIITGTIDGTVILTPPDDLFTLTLIANPEEGGEVTGAGNYFAGDDVEVDAIPNEGWEFVNWTDEDGNVVSEDAFNIIEMPAEDLTLIANFAMVEYTLTLIANPEEGGVVTGAGVYNFGDEVEVDAIPNDGWVFVNWTDEDGNFVSDEAFNIIEMPAADLTLIANFEMIEYTLTLIANPEEGGVVTGEGSYVAGEEVEVDAIPNEGWAFINWTDEDGNVVSDEAFNIIEMPAADLTLIANFEMVEYILTLIANPEEGGEVTGAGVYNFGEEVEVDAIPNEGWKFVNWTDEDGNVVSEDAFNIIEMPASDLTLIANFELLTYTLTFVVTDMDTGEVIDDAIITLNGEEYPAGMYVFEDLLPGKYDYVVSREDYFSEEGSVDIIDEDVIVEVELEFDDEDISIGEVDVLNLNIYPNPASTIMNIESNLMMSSLRLIDMLGQVVYHTTVDDLNYEINVTGFRNGVYFIQINTSKGLSTQRVQIVN